MNRKLLAPMVSAFLLAGSAAATSPPLATEWARVADLLGQPHDELARLLGDRRTDRPTRRSIPVALVFGAAFDQVPAITKAAARDPDPQVRGNAVGALGYLGLVLRQVGDLAPGVGADLLSDITGALADGLRDRDKRVRGSAAAALAAIGVSVTDSFDPLVDLLEETESDYAQEAALALGLFHGRLDAAASRLEPLLQDRREAVRVSAAAALLRVGRDTPRIREVIVAGLGSHRADAREAAASALGMFEGPGILPTLWRMLDDDVPAVRVAACQALSGHGPAARIAGARITRMLHHDRFPQVRATAALVLPQVLGVEAVPALTKALDQNRGEIGAWAALALATLHGPGREALERTSREGTPRARANARVGLEFLGQVGGR